MSDLPPPDPNEDLQTLPGLSLETPAVAFLGAPPSLPAQRLACAILAARPGALLIVARD